MPDTLVHDGLTFMATWGGVSGADDGPCNFCHHSYNGHRHVAPESLMKVEADRHVYCVDCPEKFCLPPASEQARSQDAQ